MFDSNYIEQLGLTTTAKVTDHGNPCLQFELARVTTGLNCLGAILFLTFRSLWPISSMAMISLSPDLPLAAGYGETT